MISPVSGSLGFHTRRISVEAILTVGLYPISRELGSLGKYGVSARVLSGQPDGPTKKSFFYFFFFFFSLHPEGKLFFSFKERRLFFFFFIWHFYC